MPAIQQRKPVAIEQSNVRLQRSGGDDLHRINIERLGVSMPARTGVKLKSAEWHKAAVKITRMIQRDDLHARCRTNSGQQLRPILLLVIYQRRTSRDREGIKVAVLRCDFIARDSSEMLLHSDAGGCGSVVCVMIVVRGHSQFDAFTGDGDHALFDPCITMAAVRQGVDVTVCRDPAACVHLTLQRQGQLASFIGLKAELMLRHAPLKTTPGMKHVVARRQ